MTLIGYDCDDGGIYVKIVVEEDRHVHNAVLLAHMDANVALSVEFEE